MKSHSKRVLAELSKVFNFEKFFIYALPNLIEALNVQAVIYIS